MAALTDTNQLHQKVEALLAEVLGVNKVKFYPQLPTSLKSDTPILLSETDNNKISQFMKEEKLELLVPLPLNNQKMVGALGLGPKSSGKKYNLADVNLVSAVASQLAIAWQNAKNYEEIVHALKLKDEFIAIASAHLRTPITAISGYLDYLLGKKGKIPDEEKETLIEHIKANNERLSALIDELITISALEHGRVRIIPYEASLEKIVTDAVSALSYFASENRVTISVSLPDPPLPPLKIDPGKITEAVTNVITNAIKFNKPNGSVKIAITRPNEKTTQIIITDTGIGIPANELPHLFQKFHKLGQIANPEGVGLGLYITKLIIEAHRGKVSIQSKEKVGTQVTITLPISEEIPADIVSEPISVKP